MRVEVELISYVDYLSLEDKVNFEINTNSSGHTNTVKNPVKKQLLLLIEQISIQRMCVPK